MKVAGEEILVGILLIELSILTVSFMKIQLNDVHAVVNGKRIQEAG